MQRDFRTGVTAAILLALTLLPGLVSVGLAQDTDSPAGTVDRACAADCEERGYDREQCARMCYVPPPNRLSAEDQDTDWDCLTRCVKNGSSYRECLPVCRKP